MANQNGNPNITKFAEGHRFGDAGGSDPSASAIFGNERRSKIRSALRKLACSILETDKPNMDDYARALGKKKATDLTLGEIAAIKNFQQAFANYKAMATLIDNVDGKLVEKKMESKGTLAEILAAADAIEAGGELDEQED